MSGRVGLLMKTAPAASIARWPSASCAWSTRMAARPQSVISAAAKEAERFVVEQAVAREDRTRIDIGLAFEVGEPAPRLLDENLHRRRVPRLEIGLRVDLSLARRHQAVAVVVAEAALARGRIHEADEAVPVADLLEQVEARVQQHRVFERRAGRDAEALAIGPGALALARPEELAGDRIVHHARGHLPLLFEGDEHGPDGNVAHEVLGPVDGIDDPAIGGRALLPEFLAEKARARRGAGEDAAYRLLRLAVRLGHRRLVRLDGDLEGAAIVLHRDLAGRARRLEGRDHGRMHHVHSPRSCRTSLNTRRASTTTGMPPYVTCWKMTSATSCRVAPTLSAAWMCACTSRSRLSTVSEATAQSSRCFWEMTSRL